MHKNIPLLVRMTIMLPQFLRLDVKISERFMTSTSDALYLSSGATTEKRAGGVDGCDRPRIGEVCLYLDTSLFSHCLIYILLYKWCTY